MRKGRDGLATLIQEHLKKDSFSGHLFVLPWKKCFALEYPVLGSAEPGIDYQLRWPARLARNT
ncbi:MAG: hypothetical protein U1E81_01135 [Xanthobacteraceae bacterium]